MRSSGQFCCHRFRSLFVFMAPGDVNIIWLLAISITHTRKIRLNHRSYYYVGVDLVRLMKRPINTENEQYDTMRLRMDSFVERDSTNRKFIALNMRCASILYSFRPDLMSFAQQHGKGQNYTKAKEMKRKNEQIERLWISIKRWEFSVHSSSWPDAHFTSHAVVVLFITH